MIKQYLNFDGIGAPEVIDISKTRCEEIQFIWNAQIEGISLNMHDYTYKGNSDQGSERTGVHVGKILNVMLEAANTPGEELYCIMNLDIFIDKTIERFQIKQLAGII